MKNYTIKVQLRISTKPDAYNDTVIGECDITKTALLPACKVREEATKVVRNAVAHFSEAAALGLAPLIKDEPALNESEPETLTV